MKAQKAEQLDSEAKKRKPEDDQECETEEKQRLTPIGKNTPNFPKKGANKIIFRNKFDITAVDKQVENINAEGPSPSELFKDCLDRPNSHDEESDEKVGAPGEVRQTGVSDVLQNQLFGEELAHQPDQLRKQPNGQLPFWNQGMTSQGAPFVRILNFGQGMQPGHPQNLLLEQADVQQWQPVNEAQVQQYHQLCLQNGMQFGPGDQGIFQGVGPFAPREPRRSLSAVAHTTQQQREEQINIQNDVRRQLSFRSVSNTSSNIETPMQHKRMKLRDADSSG